MPISHVSNLRRVNNFLFNPGSAQGHRPFCAVDPGNRPRVSPGRGLAGYSNCHHHRLRGGPAGRPRIGKLARFHCRDRHHRQHHPFLPGISADHATAGSSALAHPARRWSVSAILGNCHFPLAIPGLVTAPGIAAIAGFMAIAAGDWTQKGIVLASLLVIMGLNLVTLLNIEVISKRGSPLVQRVFGWVMAVLQAALAAQYLINGLVRLGALPLWSHREKTWRWMNIRRRRMFPPNLPKSGLVRLLTEPSWRGFAPACR